MGMFSDYIALFAWGFFLALVRTRYWRIVFASPILLLPILAYCMHHEGNILAWTLLSRWMLALLYGTILGSLIKKPGSEVTW